jgi:hypothetical protein
LTEKVKTAAVGGAFSEKHTLKFKRCILAKGKMATDKGDSPPARDATRDKGQGLMLQLLAVMSGAQDICR